VKEAEREMLAKQAKELPITELVEQLTVLSIEAEAWSSRGNVPRFNELSERAAIPLREIERRNMLAVLAPLMRSDSIPIALQSASSLARDEPTGVFRAEALEVLDRIAAMNIGAMSGDAAVAANIVRYGDPYPSDEQIRQVTKSTARPE
jgi:hypothetical protein